MVSALSILRHPSSVSQVADLPRTEMQINHNSDWVMRQRYEALDWGYRFSYYYDRNRVNTPALGIHWMEDNSTGSTVPTLSEKNGYIYERPIFAPDYSKDDMSFTELKKEAQLYKYVPPHVVDEGACSEG